MGSLPRDLRHALRRLRRSPGFALAAILSVGLGIGVNTAVFSLYNALILRPLPVREPHRLLRLGPVDSRGFIGAVPGAMFDWLRKDPLLDAVCGVSTPLSTAEVKGSPLPVSSHALSGTCYEMLGVRPALGRLFTPEDDTPVGQRVCVLGYDFWKNRFSADPSVIGQSIRIEGAPFTIIGVTEPRFQGFLVGFPPSVSFPITQEVNPTRNDPLAPQKLYWGFAFARLKPAASTEQVRVQMSANWRRMLDVSLPADFQGSRRTEILNEPVAVTSGAFGLDYWVRDRFRDSLVVLQAISILVLLVSCLNVANLLLARGLQRERDITVRLALGATRLQIIRELIAESAILVAAGLACSFLLTDTADGTLLAVLSRTYSGFAVSINPDARVWLFTAGVAVTALLLFGILPARRPSATNLTDVLKSGSRSAGYTHSRTRRILICGQVVFTLVLVTGAGVFVETLWRLRAESMGFQIAGVLDVQLMPLPGGYARGFNADAYYRALLDDVKVLPGVDAASLSHFSPLFTQLYKEQIRPPRRLDAPAIEAPAEPVTDGFLAAMQIPLLRGDDFQRSDSPRSQRTAIVSESLAKLIFPDGNVLGQHISIGNEEDRQQLEIIGVAADARLMDPQGRNLAFVYLNYWQYPKYEMWGDLQLRYSGDPTPLVPAVRRALRDAGHEYPIHLRTIAEARDISLLKERLLASLGAAYGMLALLLAGVGLFGLLSFFVTSRTNEIGIRLALGAKRRDIGWMVTREALALVSASVLMALPCCYAAVRVLSGTLHGVDKLPTIPLVASAALLLVVAGVATLIPLRRATSVDPMVALRYE